MCWQKVRDFNTPTGIRQAAVGYVASLLSRAKYLTDDILKEFIQEMCTWIHQYIRQCDFRQNVHSLKTHTVFYSTCQALFYVISFRSRDLTNTDTGKLFNFPMV